MHLFLNFLFFQHQARTVHAAIDARVRVDVDLSPPVARIATKHFWYSSSEDMERLHSVRGAVIRFVQAFTPNIRGQSKRDGAGPTMQAGVGVQPTRSS